MMRWKPQVAGGGQRPGSMNIGSLFVVAVISYLLGLLTSPGLPLLGTIKASSSQPIATKTSSQQTSQPAILQQAAAQVQQQVGNPESCQNLSSKQVINMLPPMPPHPGYELLPKDLITFHTSCKEETLPQEDIRKFLINKLYDGVSPFENFPPTHVKSLLQEERIRGWGSNTTVFRRLMEEVKPRVIFELGSFLGASATHLGLVAKELGFKTDILCVDDFRGWPGFRAPPFEDIQQQNGNVMLMYQFMQNVVHRNLTLTILPIPFATVSSLASFCQWGIYADLIEVDASHDFHSAWSDINIAHSLLRPGGVMFGHDYCTVADKRGVRRAVDLFAKMKNLRVEPDGQHWILRPPRSAHA